MFSVAVHSFRLWKLKVVPTSPNTCINRCCSSLVPIVETESHAPHSPRSLCNPVAVHSFRLWKLKDENEVDAFDANDALQFTRSDCGN